jgi:hypothetical protein
MIPQIHADGLSGYAHTLARNLIGTLEAHYPAFQGYWRIGVNEAGGTIEVTNLMLSGRWGFLMHIAKIDPEGRKVVRAAGELLERYRISRGRTTNVNLDNLITGRRDARGELIPDHG